MVQSVKVDINRLVGEMTLEEKISLLAGVDLWRTQAIPRLGIPAIKLTDGPNGARGADGDLGPTSALFPIGTALGATWNPELVEKVGAALAEEVKAKGAHMLLAPTVNIHRVPIAGRNFECYSEDPFLTGKMASAYIRGLQSNSVSACIKHFVCNDQEFERFSINAEVNEQALHEIYLEPFRRALLEAKPWSIMSSYNRLNGVYASENPWLLKDLLKRQWDFDGLVVSDWNGTYSDKVPAGGLDLEMPGPGRWMGEAAVRKALADGSLTTAELDDKMCRLLLLMERVGAFAEPELREERTEDTPQRRTLIRKAAQETIVLLKNEKQLLPLDVKKVKKIAVIGELADIPNVMGGGSSRVNPYYVISPLQGLQERFGKSAKIEHALGCVMHRRLPVFDPRTLTSDTGEPGGLTLRIYDNLDFSGAPAFETVTDRFSHDWWGPCVPNVHQNRFTARMSGYFTAAASGTHTFGLTVVGQGRLVLGGALLIDNWARRSHAEEQTAQVFLDAGQKIRIQVDFRWQGDDYWRYLRIGHMRPVPADPMAEAVALARKADVVIVVAGLTNGWESEGYDRVNMQLPGQQDELIRRVAQANANTVVVLNAGSPVAMPWADEVPVIVEQWYNSQECGHALADVLSGDVNPSGKLPTTFPKSYEDNPAFGNFPGKNGKVQYREGLFVGYRHYDARGIAPLFPFGHGLSYTQFEYSTLKISPARLRSGGTAKVSFDVRNTGTRAGKEIAQLYVHARQPKRGRPEQELKAFKKIELKAGEVKTVRLELGSDAFWHYSPAEHGWIVEPGEFEIRVGGSSRNLPLSALMTITR